MSPQLTLGMKGFTLYKVALTFEVVNASKTIQIKATEQSSAFLFFSKWKTVFRSSILRLSFLVNPKWTIKHHDDLEMLRKYAMDVVLEKLQTISS